MAQYPLSPDTQTSLYEEANTASSTLTSEIASGDLAGSTFTLQDGSEFPLNNFLAVIESEIILIASRSGNTLTIGARAMEGTTAATHPVGLLCGNPYTAGSRQLTKQASIDHQNYLFNYKGRVINRTVTDDTTLTPVKYDQYIVATGAINGFAGQDGKLAYYDGLAWGFITPVLGDRVYDLNAQQVLRHTGAAWIIDESLPLYDSTINWPANAAFLQAGALWLTVTAIPAGTAFDPGNPALFTPAVSVMAMNDLSDVNAPAPNNTDLLSFNSTTGDWESSPVQYFYSTGELIDVPQTYTNVLTLNFTVIKEAVFTGSLNFTVQIGSTSQAAQFRTRTDGGPWTEFRIESKDPNNIEPFSFNIPQEYALGAHTLEFEAQAGGGAQVDVTRASYIVDQGALL